MNVFLVFICNVHIISYREIAAYRGVALVTEDET